MGQPFSCETTTCHTSTTCHPGDPSACTAGTAADALNHVASMAVEYVSGSSKAAAEEVCERSDLRTAWVVPPASAEPAACSLACKQQQVQGTLSCTFRAEADPELTPELEAERRKLEKCLHAVLALENCAAQGREGDEAVDQCLGAPEAAECTGPGPFRRRQYETQFVRSKPVEETADIWVSMENSKRCQYVREVVISEEACDEDAEGIPEACDDFRGGLIERWASMVAALMDQQHLHDHYLLNERPDAEQLGVAEPFELARASNATEVQGALDEALETTIVADAEGGGVEVDQTATPMTTYGHSLFHISAIDVGPPPGHAVGRMPLQRLAQERAAAGHSPRSSASPRHGTAKRASPGQIPRDHHLVRKHNANQLLLW
mmetsp:Transcript_47697/g.102189  ORF Transcript_47697/g.102189 Transcript_47697/m.102189 type:complete len:378 (-) Transcript_47697:157-1290(-)